MLGRWCFAWGGRTGRCECTVYRPMCLFSSVGLIYVCFSAPRVGCLSGTDGESILLQQEVGLTFFYFFIFYFSLVQVESLTLGGAFSSSVFQGRHNFALF